MCVPVRAFKMQGEKRRLAWIVFVHTHTILNNIQEKKKQVSEYILK